MNYKTIIQKTYIASEQIHVYQLIYFILLLIPEIKLGPISANLSTKANVHMRSSEELNYLPTLQRML